MIRFQHLPFLATLVPFLSAGAPADAQEAESVGRALIRAAALAVVCAERTGGEVGAPTAVLNVYIQQAAGKFAAQFGKSLDAFGDLDQSESLFRADTAGFFKSTD